MASPRPSVRKSAAKSARARLLIIGGGSLGVALVGCWLVARLTETGVLGFGIAIVAVGVAALALVGLREIRRLSRAARRAESAVHRAESAVRRSGHESATAIQQLRDAVADQKTTLEVLVGVQTEATRALTAGLRDDELQARLAAQLRRQQAMLNLFALTPVQAVVPPMGGDDLDADVIATLAAELLSARPRVVLECGSGVSTLWIALVLEHYGLDSHGVSLEHDPRRAERTRRALCAHGVDRFVEVRDAPLVPTTVEGITTNWYSPSARHELTDVGLLVVVGPTTVGPLGRFPAVPELRSSLAPSATVVLVGSARPGDREISARWRLLLSDFQVVEPWLDADVVVFRRDLTGRAHA